MWLPAEWDQVWLNVTICMMRAGGAVLPFQAARTAGEAGPFFRICGYKVLKYRMDGFARAGLAAPD
jgi:hypothetical protein